MEPGGGGSLNDQQSPPWECEAYGAGAAAVGALCFFAEPGLRTCHTAAQCHDRMAGERNRVFQRINELAADGDEVGQYLAEHFTSPDDLLGGSDDPSSGPEGGQS